VSKLFDEQYNWGGPPPRGPLASECFCVGPQNGEPMCPCAMKAERQARLIQRFGRNLQPEESVAGNTQQLLLEDDKE